MRFIKFAMIAVALGLSFQVLADNSEANFSPAQTAQIQKIVQQYLLDNPQILLEVGQKLQQQQMAQIQASQKQAKKTIPTLADLILQAPNSPVAGNSKGNVTLVEFFDYQCSHCRDMTPVVSKLIQQDPNLRVVYKEFPIDGDNSEFAARMALAAAKQGKYQAVHDALMQAPLPLTSDSMLTLASGFGLNMKTLQQDMNSPAIEAELKQNDALGKKLQLMGTPAFIISPSASEDTNQATLVPGATNIATLQQLINSMHG